ncbi:MAG: GNAT family N-acetyltransferase [Henriciella sp.]|uniref:GNAT family N-acetyltransferase n=1 Tax=Henriciella sp. TaxID=1968823 RepID=UPI003C77B609
MSRARPVPVILTERLRLRAHEAADFDTLANIWRDAAIIRFIGGKARTPSEVWTTIQRNRGLWQTMGYGYWLAEERRTGDFIGEVGFADFHRDSEPRFWGTPECGWIIAPTQHGKGYASEAVSAIHDWFDEELEADESVCIIDDENAASIRISAKLGYTPSGTVLFDGSEVGFYRRKRGSQKA